MLDVNEGPDELVITIETTLDVVGCGRCGTQAESQDRKVVDMRDLACFGRPARLRWIKRRWRCVDAVLVVVAIARRSSETSRSASDPPAA